MTMKDYSVVLILCFSPYYSTPSPPMKILHAFMGDPSIMKKIFLYFYVVMMQLQKWKEDKMGFYLMLLAALLWLKDINSYV